MPPEGLQDRFYKFGVLVLGVLMIKALELGVSILASDSWKLPHSLQDSTHHEIPTLALAQPRFEEWCCVECVASSFRVAAVPMAVHGCLWWVLQTSISKKMPINIHMSESNVMDNSRAILRVEIRF